MSGVQKQPKYKSKSKKKQMNSSVKTQKHSSQFKFESAAIDCLLEQSTIKKPKHEAKVSPMQFEEGNHGSKISTMESVKEELFCEEAQQEMENSFSFQARIDGAIQEEEQPESHHEMMKEQLKYESSFSYNLNYLEQHQDIQPYMMHMLYDWLIEVSYSFHFKRETFYIALNYVARYLSIKREVKKEILQLVGATALLIAHKCEEIYPTRLSQFRSLTQNLYSEEAFEEMEVDILKILCFRMNPNTPIFWLNYYSKLWDDYIRERVPSILFRERTIEAYYRYRELVQLFDCCMIDYHFQHDPKLAALGLMYIVIGRNLQVFPDAQEISKSRLEIRQFVEMEADLNEWFSHFLEISNIYVVFETKIQFSDLYDLIADLTKYFVLEIDCSYPQALKRNPQLASELPLEEILSFQTHNRHTLTTLRLVSNQ